MKVSAILADKGARVVTMKAAATLQEAAGVLDKERIGAVIVTGAGDAIDGVLSERDIAREVARSGAKSLKKPVGECMTRDVVTIGPDAALDDVMTQMTDRRIRHLPVLEDGKLAGIISIGDVVKHKIALTEAEADAMRDYISTG